MLVAAYAPLKPPDDPVPSGDRRMARLIAQALQQGGHRVEWAARFRSRDASGNRLRQLRLALLGARLAERLLRRYLARPVSQRPQAWLTYHLYYKAPDHLGPAVARGLGIPYVVVEASIANKRAGGAWDIGHRATLAALAQATTIVSLNPGDARAIDAFRAPATAHYLQAPFLEAAHYAQTVLSDQPPLRLLAIGMMRSGDKQRSYEILAQALGNLVQPWRLTIVGDGPARPAIEAAFAGLGPRVVFAGLADSAQIAAALADSDVYVWPAIGEAFGMAILEAQASGLPVVAGAMPGVAAIVADGTTGLLTPPGDAAAFGAALATLGGDPALRARMGAAAFAKVRAVHDLPAAAALFDRVLRRAA
jgi:glycosyltransferase involved in cell wall biosynthesis